MLQDAIALAQAGCKFGWAAQVFGCFERHGEARPLVRGAPIKMQLGELEQSFGLQRQSDLDSLPLDPRSCSGPGVKLYTYRHSRICRLCHTGALGDERHMLLECSALSDLRAEFSTLVSECSGVMARLMWSKDQLLLSRYIIRCLDRMSC